MERASVSEILEEKFGLSIRRGAKGTCPFCGHNHFQIRGDDTLGKCFYPSCGRFITPFQYSDQYNANLSSALDGIFADFHKALMEQKEVQQGAYSYLVSERQIHPQVVRDSMLGVVPSTYYDLEEKFSSVLQKAEQAIAAQSQLKKRRTDTSEYTPEKHLEFLKVAKEKLKSCISGRQGWLAFFYTDHKNRIVAIRFRRPYSKDFVYFKPFEKIAGVFGHGLFLESESGNALAIEGGHLLVVEGEVNQLQLQTLSTQIALASKSGNCYRIACAVGGVSNVDTATIRKLSDRIMVCYDNDSAGISLVEKLQKATSLDAFTVVGAKDLDEFICGFRGRYEEAWKALNALIAARKSFYRPYEMVREEVDSIREREGVRHGLKSFQAHRKVAGLVIKDFKDRGDFYHDGVRSYVFLKDDKKLFEIKKDNHELQILLNRYGLAPEKEVTEQVVHAVRLHTIEKGIKTNIYNFSHYDHKSNRLYLFNQESQVFRITAEKVEVVDNGTDGVLFLKIGKREKLELVESTPDKPAIFDLIFSSVKFEDGVLNALQQKLLLNVWYFSLFFPELFPTRPILALVGIKGSGKSFLLRKIGTVLFGSGFNVTPVEKDAKDFDAAITNEHLVALDNADSHVSWLEDRLAVLATGGTIKRRGYFTTNDLVEFPVSAYLGITSRTPHFRRDDIAERLLILNLTRFDRFVSQSKLLREVEENRNVIITESIYVIQRILRVFEQQKSQTYEGNFRMADFADFGLKVAAVIGWTPHMERMLSLLGDKQSSFTLEGDPIVDLLELWLKQDKNHGREVTSNELCKDLGELGEKSGIDFPYRGKTRSFAQRLNNHIPLWEKIFAITKREGGGRKMYYTFKTRKDESGID